MDPRPATAGTFTAPLSIGPGVAAATSGPPDAQPLRYQPAYEHAEPDEAAAIAQLQEIFIAMAQKAAQQHGSAHRAVHAKGQALLRARLQVLPGLPPHLAQGLFAEPAGYDAIVRFSSPPAEQLPDGVSTPRAVALKVVNVPGQRVPESPDGRTQDFLMVNGPVFVRPGPQGFVKDARLLAATTGRAPRAKEVLSTVLRGTEAVLQAVGADSTALKGMGGQPPTHPLGETYFTQVPFLYGPYMAKFSLAPASPSLAALQGRDLPAHDHDAQRHAINAFFAAATAAAAEWELRVQLCMDIDRMPIEDASVEWDAALSPHIPVARLIIPPQTAWDEAVSPLAEAELAFDPWHALAAHRPLGAINRARRIVMAASRGFRSTFNRCPIHEPGEPGVH